MEPEAPSVVAWKHEAQNWLQQMEEMLPHVGKKTSAEWRSIIEERKTDLEQ
jgi:hypothetical protein